MENIQIRNQSYQKSIDVEDLKRKRDENVIEIRKKKRIEHVNKKRALYHDTELSFEFNCDKVPDLLANVSPNIKSDDMSSLERFGVLLDIINRNESLEILGVCVKIFSGILSSSNPPHASAVLLNNPARKLLILFTIKNILIQTQIS